MTVARVDFAVVGSSPLAAIVAGLLALEHGKSVACVGSRPSPFVPPDGIEASIAPIVRPETWALLKEGVPETLRTLRRIDRRAIRRLDCDFLAHDARAAEALAHMRHLVAGFGLPVERLAVPAGVHYRIPDAFGIDRAAFADAAFPWLESAGVLRCEDAATHIAVHREGIVIDRPAGAFEAGRLILAEDAAIVSLIEPAALPAALVAVDATALLLDAGRGPIAGVEYHVDRGVTLIGRSAGLIALAPGLPDAARGPVGEALGHRIAWLAGTRRLRRLETRDGAPFVGTTRGMTILAGFGPIGVFLAPAIARHLAAASTPAENRWFTRHGAGRGRARIAEYRPSAAGVEAA